MNRQSGLMRHLLGTAFITLLLGLSIFVQQGEPGRLLDALVNPAWAEDPPPFGEGTGTGSVAPFDVSVSITASNQAPDPGRAFVLLLEVADSGTAFEGATVTLDLPAELELAGEPSLQPVCVDGGTCVGTLAAGYSGSGTLVESLTLPTKSFAAIAVPVKVAEDTATGTDLSVDFTATHDGTAATSESALITVAEDCNPELDTVVTHNGDSGPGSLRCLLETLPAGSTITFADDFAAEEAIALYSTLYVTRSLTLDGGGHSVEVDGGWDGEDNTTGVRVMTLLPGADEVTLRGVTLRRGNAGDGSSEQKPWRSGGGLSHLAGNGILQLEAVTLKENLAQYGGGLFNVDGHVAMSDGLITANTQIGSYFRGGGVYNYAGTLTARRTSFVDNGGDVSGSGGGLFNRNGDVVLTDVLFRGNVATAAGGLDNSGQATLTNVLFDSNIGHGLRNYRSSATATLRHVTITGSSRDGLDNSGSLALYNSVLADNDTGGNGFKDCDNTGTLTANAGNWIAVGSCSPAYTGDPKLDASGTPLADSGLINAADNAECPAADLNGLARPQGAGCDIGAVEFADGATHTLTLEREGSGSVTADQGAIDCGDICDGSYAENAYITLTATPDSEGEVVTWSGCDSSGANQCEVTLTDDKTVTATFAPPSYSLTLDAGTGGSITADPNQAEYSEGTTVTLTANPDTGYSFSGWSGACTGAVSEDCEVVMDSDKMVGVRFEAEDAFGIENNSGGGGGAFHVLFWVLGLLLLCRASGNDPQVKRWHDDGQQGS